MDVSRPYSAISPSLEGDVLVVLAAVTKPLTGRAIARRARQGTQPAVNAALDRLCGQGLVLKESAPPANLYRLNVDHVGSPAVEAMAGMRAELFKRLRTEVESWEIEPVHASVFGSTARADGDMGSDIDILIVHHDDITDESAAWRDQIERLSQHVFSWSGNQASIVEFGASRVRHALSVSPSVTWTDVERDHVHLFGKQFKSLLGVG